MKVILLQDIKGTGKKDQLLEVSDGFARNYLFPKKLAVEANSAHMHDLQSQKEAQVHRKAQEKEQAAALCEKLKGTSVTLTVRTGKDGKLFGAVTGQEISLALKEQQHLDVDKKKIVLSEPLRHTGTYEAELKLYPELSATITVIVKAGA